LGLAKLLGLNFQYDNFSSLNFKKNLVADNIYNFSLAKEVVGRRFGPNKEERKDMLGSFLHHGLTQEEAESETLVQLLVHITV
jgi:hypothetical protein